MEEDILAIKTPVIFDESIEHSEIHAYQPYATSTYNNSDEIRIAVQHQDLCLLISKSFLHIYGKFTKADGTAVSANSKLVNLAVGHLFEEIRYELNAVEIDRSKNVGLTCLIISYISLSPTQNAFIQNASWLNADESVLTNEEGYFDVCIPLNLSLGFAEDYRKIIVNAKHELILTRANTDTNAIFQTRAAGANKNAAFEDVSIDLQKVKWMIPYNSLSDTKKIQLLNYISKDPAIPITFRSWELYEYPLLPTTTKHVWAVKTSTQLEKPRYVVLGFQTARKNNKLKNASLFDHCDIRDVKLFLNSQCYPYGNMNNNINRNLCSLFYNLYCQFQTSYYDGKEPEPLLTKKEFLAIAPLVVIDCSMQNEASKSGPVDIRLEFETNTEFLPQTYCLILHDRIVEYHPISGGVTKLV